MTLKNDLLPEALSYEDENERLPLPQMRREDRRVPILGDDIHGGDEDDRVQEQRAQPSEGLVRCIWQLH